MVHDLQKNKKISQKMYNIEKYITFAPVLVLHLLSWR